MNSCSDAAILIDSGTLSIEISQLTAEGKRGISGRPQNEKLVIKSYIVMASSNAGKFAIGDFKNGISLADCEIMSPQRSATVGVVGEDDGRSLRFG